MSYRTTCPNCASVFRLGEDQLGAAQGWVQCSVCGTAFDARLSLLLEDGSPLPPPEPEPADVAMPAEAAATAEPEAHEAAPAETAEPAPEVSPSPTPATESFPPTDTLRGIAQRETTPDLDSIILIDPDIPVPEDPGPLPQIYPAPSSYPPASASPAEPEASPPAAAPARAKAMPAARIEYAAPAVEHTRPFRTPLRMPSWVWAVASVLLAIVLLAQTAYFLRDTLVSRLPQTRPAFEQACSALGCTLSLPKNLAQLQIVGSDLQTEASGRLKLTLTLGNRAGQAQAWPVLMLTLTDQRNRPLARRSFAPSEYLGDSQRIEAGIPPRSEQILSLPLTVRGPAPMGFDLQLGY